MYLLWRSGNAERGAIVTKRTRDALVLDRAFQPLTFLNILKLNMRLYKYYFCLMISSNLINTIIYWNLLLFREKKRPNIIF